MNPNYLDFEQPIADLEAKIHELRQASNGPAVNIDAEIHALQDKLRKRTAHIFRDLTPWQVSQLARHPMRPYTLDYVKVVCDEFEELAGDRAFADDAAIVGGLGRIDGRPVVIIGHQKGRDSKSKVRRNFGMPRPEGYRKALRLMKMAERFRLPLLTFIDTMGAYPGIGAEERGQSEAIARNLMEMAELKTPIVCTVMEGRAQGQGRGRTARPHRQAPARAGPGRQGGARADRRRPPQSAPDRGPPQDGTAERARCAGAGADPRSARTPLPAPARLRRLRNRLIRGPA